MKARIFIAASVLALTPMLGIAGDTNRVTVTGDPEFSKMSMDEQGINACFQECIAEIVPGGQVAIKTVDGTQSSEVFRGSDPFLKNKKMMVFMEARSADDNAMLASARCKVGHDADVAFVKTKIRDPAALANITMSDLRFVASIR